VSRYHVSRFTLSLPRPWTLAALIVLAALSGLAIARLPLTTLIASLGALALVVGTLIEPAIGLIATLVLGPWAAWERTYLPALLPTDVGQLSVALALGAWGVRGLVRREFNIPRLPLLVPLSIFTGWAAVTMLWAPDYSFGLPEVLKWIELAFMALFAVDVAQRRGVKWIVFGVLLSAVVQAFVGIYEARIRGIGPEGFLLSQGVYRAYGSFEQPNPFGGFIGLNLPIAVGLALALWAEALGRANRLRVDSRRFTDHPFFLAVLTTGVTLMLAAALYLSFSRGAWLGAVAALLAMGLFLPRRRWIGLALIGGLMAIGLGLSQAGLLPAAIADRFADVGSLVNAPDVRGVKINDANYALIERLAHWQAAVDMIEANPWTGVGFSNYQPSYEKYRLLNWPMPLGHAHNIYLNVAAETGLPGLAAYIILWIAIFVQTVRALKYQHGVRRGLALGLLGAWVHLSAHHLFDNLYVDNVHLNIGAMIGVLSVLSTATSPGVELESGNHAAR
jgi:putative inorganic carbon (hco3(-)) transporter